LRSATERGSPHGHDISIPPGIAVHTGAMARGIAAPHYRLHARLAEC
jgi:hypothetical protein